MPTDAAGGGAQRVRVTFELVGYLAWYAPGRATVVTVEVPRGTSILAAVRMAKLPYGEVAFAAVGEEQRELSDPITRDERITLIPPVSGG